MAGRDSGKDDVDAPVEVTVRVGHFHVSYPEFIANSMTVVDEVYRCLDLDSSGETRQSMRALEARRPQHKHGVHGYDIE